MNIILVKLVILLHKITRLQQTPVIQGKNGWFRLIRYNWVHT
jgi:hypothetical protein